MLLILTINFEGKLTIPIRMSIRLKRFLNTQASDLDPFGHRTLIIYSLPKKRLVLKIDDDVSHLSSYLLTSLSVLP